MAYRHGCLLIAGLTEEQKLYKLIKGADKWNMETALKRYCNPWGFYHKNVHRVLNSVNSRDGYITGLGAILHRVLKCGFLENDQIFVIPLIFIVPISQLSRFDCLLNLCDSLLCVFHYSEVVYQGCLTMSLFALTSPEKLAQAKEENLNMHQVLDQTLLELNNL